MTRHRLRPVGGPWVFCNNMNILAGGRISEDIDMYHRVHEMLNRFNGADSRHHYVGEGFIHYWEYTTNTNALNNNHVMGIPGSHSMTVFISKFKRYSESTDVSSKQAYASNN